MFQLFYRIGPVGTPQSVHRLLMALGMCLGGLSVMACNQPPSSIAPPRPTQVAQYESVGQASRVTGGAPHPTHSHVFESANSPCKQDYKQAAVSLAITLAPVTATETAQLTQANAPTKGEPLQVGFGRAIPAADQAEVLLRLAWTRFSDGTLAGAFTVTSPKARSLRLGLIASTLAEGVEIRFFCPQCRSGVLNPSIEPFTKELLPSVTTGSQEPEDPEQFWSPVVQGDSIGVEVHLPSARALQTSAVHVLQVSHMN